MESEPLFTFIHCADLHLDSPFEGVHAVEPWVAEILRKATFDAFQQVVNIALQEKCDFIIISGDVYDGADRSLHAKLRFRDILRSVTDANLSCYIVHGNHDPLSGWEPEITLPNGVVRFAGEQVSKFTFCKENEELAHIYGISFQERAIQQNLARSFRKETKEVFSIGILHCNVGGIPNHDNYAPCSLDDLITTGIDYWALGHVHTPMIIHKHDPIIIYPGNTQGRNITEYGPRGCYLTKVYENGNADFEFRATDIVRWFREEIDISELSTLDDLLDVLIQRREDVRLRAENRHAILRLVLTGRGELHHLLRQRIDPEKDLASPLREGEINHDQFVWIESVTIKTRPMVDIEHRRIVEDFVGDYLRVIDSARKKPDVGQKIWEILSQRPEWAVVSSELEHFSRDELLDILNEAEYYGLDKLLQEDEDNDVHY